LSTGAPPEPAAGAYRALAGSWGKGEEREMEGWDGEGRG